MNVCCYLEIMKRLRNIKRNFKNSEDRNKWIRQLQVVFHRDLVESRDIRIKMRIIEKLNLK